MGMNKPDIHDQLQMRRTALVFDHFNTYTDGQLWTKTLTGAGATVANNDGDGGILTLTTGATQNNEAAVTLTRKNFTFVANKPMIFQTALKYTEGNVNNAGIFLGFASSFTKILADTTWALPASLSGCGIYKKPGDTLWSCFSSVGATQLTNQSTAVTQAAGVIQELIIQVMIQQTNIEVTFWQGSFGATTITGGGGQGQIPMLPNVTTMARQQPIKHVIALAGAAAMTMGVFVKSGDAGGTSEVASVDYIGSEFLSMP